MQLCVYILCIVYRELSDICAADQLHEERKKSFNKRRGRSLALCRAVLPALPRTLCKFPVRRWPRRTPAPRGMQCCMLQRTRLVSLSDKSVQRPEKTPLLASLIAWRMWVRLGSNEWSGAVDHRKWRTAAPFARPRRVENSRRLAPLFLLVGSRRTPAAAHWIGTASAACRKKKQKRNASLFPPRSKAGNFCSRSPAFPSLVRSVLPATRFGMRGCSISGSFLFFLTSAFYHSSLCAM